VLVSKYLPTLGFSLWPCAVLLLVFIPVSIWHERNWRRTLAAYSLVRREAGAPEGDWPSPDLRHLMGVQPGLVLLVCAILAVMVVIAGAAVLIWPRTPPGFDLPINPYDVPFIWSMIVAGSAAVVAGIAVANDLAHNPWSKVAWFVRRAIYARAEQRAEFFVRAVAVDPEVPHVTPDAPSTPAGRGLWTTPRAVGRIPSAVRTRQPPHAGV
jgi:hypothetical protein